jgi:hypothetical protein
VMSTFNNPPVDMWSIHPLNVMPVLGVAPIGEVQYVIHTEKRSVQSIINFLSSSGADTGALEVLMAEKPRWFSPGVSLSELNDMAFQLENYWGWHDIGGKFVVFNAIRYDNLLIRPFTPMPNYKVLPWAFAPAIDTGADKLEDRWLPVHIAAGIHSDNLEEWQGYLKNIVRKLSDQMFMLKRGPGKSGESQYEILADNKSVIELEDGDDLVSPSFAPLSPDVWRQADVISNQLEVSGLPRTSWGVAGEGTGFAYDRAQDGARMKFIPPHESLVFATEQAARGIMSLVAVHNPGDQVFTLTKKLGRKTERVLLTGAELSPALWDVEVGLDARLPGDETRDATLAQMWYAGGNGILSGETVRRRYGKVEDVVAEAERIIAEKALVGDERIRNAYAIDILDRMDALPPMSPQQEFEIQYNVETMRSRGGLLGLPPQMIEQLVQQYLEIERQNFLRSLQGQASGQAPSPQQPPPSAPQDPRMGGAMANGGALQSLMSGMAPPGNPADPMAEQRMMMNQMNGTAGRQQ